MESPLLIIIIRKKKFTQWLKLNHKGNPFGSEGDKAGRFAEGSIGKPKAINWHHAAPTVNNNKITTITSARGLIPINHLLSSGKRISRSASLKLVNIIVKN